MPTSDHHRLMSFKMTLDKQTSTYNDSIKCFYYVWDMEIHFNTKNKPYMLGRWFVGLSGLAFRHFSMLHILTLRAQS